MSDSPAAHVGSLCPANGAVSEHARLRLDQVRGSSAPLMKRRVSSLRALMSSYVRKSAFVIHSQAKPELVRITRNFRRNDLTIVTLWHSGSRPGLS